MGQWPAGEQQDDEQTLCTSGNPCRGCLRSSGRSVRGAGRADGERSPLPLLQLLQHRHLPHPPWRPHPLGGDLLPCLCWGSACPCGWLLTIQPVRSGLLQRGYGYQNQARSAPEGMNVMNVIQWISMLQEVYEKFDYNDLECQKKLICEVMREPEYFGNMSSKLKSGFQMTRYLEVLNMPDDFRELLDEYMDASERSEGQKACEEFFQCPYSIKDSVKRNFSGNSL